MTGGFHSLRYAYAQECERRGMPIPHIASRHGHWSEASTEVSRPGEGFGE